jgi:hypothetical protein
MTKKIEAEKCKTKYIRKPRLFVEETHTPQWQII